MKHPTITKYLCLALFLLLSVGLQAKQIKKGDVIILFSISDGYYQAEINRKEWRSAQTIKLCKEEELIFPYYGSALYSADSAKDLYTLVFRPIEKHIKKGDHLYFTPAGQLYFINLAALRNEHGILLGDLYHFHRLSSLKEYSKSKEQPPHVDWLLFGGMDYLADPDLMFDSVRMLHVHNLEYLFADITPTDPTDILSFGTTVDGTRAGFNNLPHSRDEMKALWELKGSFGIQFYTGYHACEEEFRSTVSVHDPYIALISTHGFTYGGNTHEEMACGLIFSGAGHTIEGRKLPYNLNDGILYAPEIETLDMKAADMVILAACNTGLGVVTQDGIIGLQTAFKKAGVKTLVLTLWSVNDKATATFTESLFTHLHKGKNKHDAFESAIEDLKQSFQDPVYWAPFIMLD